MKGQSLRTALRALLVAAALLAAVLLVGAAVPGRAAAAPLEPTLNLAQLQTLLNSGPVTGYFKTVDQGANIATIPMTIDSIVGMAGPDGALILFQADMTNPIMARIGNIAEGMSGSPLFVNDGTGDKLIGALSYGDFFTLAGFGLATPIEYMSADEANNALRSPAASRSTQSVTLPLPKPASLPDGGTVSRIVVAPSVAAAEKTPHPAGTGVFAPLDTAQISGLPYGSAAYKQMATWMQKRGYNVRQGLGTGPGGWDPNFTTPLVSGAALATMYTRGDFWAGAIGTVTYVNGPRLMAFGHSMDWIGTTSLYLCNAQIDGIWADSEDAYKIGSPGAVRGELTLDRGSAVGGRLDQTPVDVPITSHAEVTTNTSPRTADSTTNMTRFWADSPDQFGSELAAAAASVPIYQASDVASLPGSAVTTTTVHLTDGTTPYTVTRTNLWNDPYDVQWDAADDVYEILGTLEANPYGIAPATIQSVNLTTTATRNDVSAIIGDISLPGGLPPRGLHTGDNTLHVMFFVNGSTTPQSVDVVLHLDPGIPTKGMLQVSPATYSDSFFDFGPMARRTPVTDPRLTLAQTVAALNSEPTNDMIKVTFMPNGSSDSSAPITATADTPWVPTGQIFKPTSSITLSASPQVVKKGGQHVSFHGLIFGASSDETVYVYRAYVGSSAAPTLVATLKAASAGSGANIAAFAWKSPVLHKSAKFTAVWDGDAYALGASVTKLVTVKKH